MLLNHGIAVKEQYGLACLTDPAFEALELHLDLADSRLKAHPVEHVRILGGDSRQQRADSGQVTPHVAPRQNPAHGITTAASISSACRSSSALATSISSIPFQPRLPR